VVWFIFQPQSRPLSSFCVVARVWLGGCACGWWLLRLCSSSSSSSLLRYPASFLLRPPVASISESILHHGYVHCHLVSSFADRCSWWFDFDAACHHIISVASITPTTITRCSHKHPPTPYRTSLSFLPTMPSTHAPVATRSPVKSCSTSTIVVSLRCYALAESERERERASIANE
jgi:hypothetical protein